MQSNNLTTLEQRRRDHCIKLASELSEEDNKLNRLLPPRKCHMTRRNSRSNKECFYNLYSKTNRLKKNPILHTVDIFNSSKNHVDINYNML